MLSGWEVRHLPWLLTSPFVHSQPCGKTTFVCPSLRHSRLPQTSAPQHLNMQTSLQPALSSLAICPPMVKSTCHHCTQVSHCKADIQFWAEMSLRLPAKLHVCALGQPGADANRAAHLAMWVWQHMADDQPRLQQQPQRQQEPHRQEWFSHAALFQMLCTLHLCCLERLA